MRHASDLEGTLLVRGHVLDVDDRNAIAEAIAAAEREAYNRGVTDGVAGLRDKLVDVLDARATKYAAGGSIAGRMIASTLRAVAECVNTAKVEVVP